MLKAQLARRSNGRATRGEALVLSHGRAFREGLQHLRQTPLASVIGVLIMAIALGLPALLDALLLNQRSLAAAWGGAPSVTVFVRPGLTASDTLALAERVRRTEEVAAVAQIDAATALAEFSAATGVPSVPGVNATGLPQLLVVTPQAGAWQGGRADTLVERLQALPDVEQVVVDFAWVERLAALGSLARRAVLLLGLILGAATMLVVGNTIRVLVAREMPAIEVQKLLGATDDFVRRPFLYSGAVQGLLAGLLALALVAGALAALRGPVARLAEAYASRFTLGGLPAIHALVLVAFAAALGWCGAWLGIGLSLRRLEPAGTRS